MKHIEQQVKIDNATKGKGAMILGGGLVILSSLIYIPTFVTEIACRLDSSVHHIIFKDIKSAAIVSGITFGIGLASAVYGAIKYYDSTK
jgi:hypothetical protein